jgi:hypothetical protein
MATGVLIAESMRVGSELAGLPLTVDSVSRIAIPDPAACQPAVWTLISFETDVDPSDAAARLSEVLDTPGWYVALNTDDEVFVAFTGKVFRYSVGDSASRAIVADYARSVGVPDSQLDW